MASVFVFAAWAFTVQTATMADVASNFLSMVSSPRLWMPPERGLAKTTPPGLIRSKKIGRWSASRQRLNRSRCYGWLKSFQSKTDEGGFLLWQLPGTCALEPRSKKHRGGLHNWRTANGCVHGPFHRHPRGRCWLGGDSFLDD